MQSKHLTCTRELITAFYGNQIIAEIATSKYSKFTIIWRMVSALFAGVYFSEHTIFLIDKHILNMPRDLASFGPFSAEFCLGELTNLWSRYSH